MSEAKTTRSTPKKSNPHLVAGAAPKSAVSARVALHAERAVLIDRATHPGERRVGIVHRQRGDEAEEPIVAPNELRQPVVGLFGELRRTIGTGDRLERRQRQADHLHVVAELVENLQARVDVDDRADVRDPLADVPAAPAVVDVLLEEPLGKDVVEEIDFHASFRVPAPAAYAAAVAISAGADAAQNTRRASPA